MGEHPWFEEFPGSIVVCDTQGIVLEMNAKAIQMYEKDGGAALIGKNVLDCHPGPARAKLQALLDAGTANVYTIEKNGVHKLIYQVPWSVDGQYRGIMELALEIPAEAPHFVRDKEFVNSPHLDLDSLAKVVLTLQPVGLSTRQIAFIMSTTF